MVVTPIDTLLVSSECRVTSANGIGSPLEFVCVEHETPRGGLIQGRKAAIAYRLLSLRALPTPEHASVFGSFSTSRTQQVPFS